MGDFVAHSVDTDCVIRRTRLRPMPRTVTCPKCATEMPVDFSFCGKCGNRLTALETLEGETRQVTVLFADISGFTALAERLNPDELHENMRTAWDAIAAEIRAQGGLIEKYIGDAVVAVFGAVGDQDDHPERAQHAAIAILGALERENARIAERTGRYLALRVGVNTGLAATGAIGDKESEFGVLGDAVNIAARLEQAAEPGQVLVGDATYRRTAGIFAYEPHPPVAAKGKTAPLVAWRLLREEAASAPSRRRAPLVGRDAEVAQLVGALDDALAGKGRTISIVGEAGLGKTRLVDEVLADPRALGARVAGRAHRDRAGPRQHRGPRYHDVPTRAHTPMDDRARSPAASARPARRVVLRNAPDVASSRGSFTEGGHRRRRRAQQRESDVHRGSGAMDPRDRRRCRTRRRQPARGCEPHERPARRTADVAPPARRTGNARRTSSAARDRGGRARDRFGDHPRDRRAWCRRRREPCRAPRARARGSHRSRRLPLPADHAPRARIRLPPRGEPR